MRLRPENEMLAICLIAIAVIVLASWLGGCTTMQPLQATAPCPRPNIPTEPHYPLQDLKQGDSHTTVAKAYVATLKGQHDYIQQLKHILRGYG
jgi:hypothetical protein